MSNRIIPTIRMEKVRTVFSSQAARLPTLTGLMLLAMQRRDALSAVNRYVQTQAKAKTQARLTDYI